MLDERGPRGASGFAGHSDGFVFHRESGDENSDFAGFPCVRIIPSREATAERGRRPVPSSGSQGWTSGFFPGELWLLIRRQGRSSGSRRRRNGPPRWPRKPRRSRAVDPTDIGFIIGTSFGNGYRLTGDPSYKERASDRGQFVGVALQSEGRGGSLLAPFRLQSQFAVIIDSMMTLGPLQWGASNGGSSCLGRNRGDARPDGDHQPRALGRQHVPARRFQPDDRGAAEPGDIRRLFRRSTWARGQAWALYGFVQAYQTSDNPAFLKTAEGIANYFVGQLPADGIPPWDFDAPGSQACGHFGGCHRGGRPRHAEYGCGNERP